MKLIKYKKETCSIRFEGDYYEENGFEGVTVDDTGFPI